MRFKGLAKILAGVMLTFNLLSYTCCAIECRIFSSQELEKIGIELQSIDYEEVLSILHVLYTESDPTLKKDELKTFVSIADMKRIDLNSDGKEDLVALINHRGMSDPVEVFLLCSVENKFVAQTLSTERATLDTTILDLNNDGIYEVRVNSTIAGETPHALVVYWVDVYSWSGQRYVQNNEQFFESFYLRRYLPYLSERLKDVGKRLEWGEQNKTLSAVLNDCRTAIQKVSTIQNNEIDRKLQLSEQLILLHQNLSLVSTQIKHVQEMLSNEEKNNNISLLLEESRVTLQQLSNFPNKNIQ
jgi:hypothetical protein